MSKLYQVFVGSTYADLREERSLVIKTLMEMDCIPSVMEFFPAADENQFEFIKKVIDDCDYYLLIIGGRYGSTTSEGISYTEKEYQYAISKGLKVIALLHQDPDSIPVGKTDKDAESAKRLAEFREKVQEGRLVKYWSRAEELPGIVSLSLSKTIKTHPAAGWVRGNAAASAEVLLRDSKSDAERQARKEPGKQEFGKGSSRDEVGRFVVLARSVLAALTAYNSESTMSGIAGPVTQLSEVAISLGNPVPIEIQTFPYPSGEGPHNPFPQDRFEGSCVIRFPDGSQESGKASHVSGVELLIESRDSAIVALKQWLLALEHNVQQAAGADAEEPYC